MVIEFVAGRAIIRSGTTERQRDQVIQTFEQLVQGILTGHIKKIPVVGQIADAASSLVEITGDALDWLL